MENLFQPNAFTLRDKIINIGAAFSFMLVWWILMVLIMFNLWDANLFTLENMYPSTAWRLFGALVTAPIVEELIFRKAALGLVHKSKVIPIVIISSAVFGWLHTGGGPINPWLMQGVLGVGFCWVYLRNNYSYWSSVILHFMWNGSMTLVTLMMK